jgi:two-component system chemotaxis sensor kinase CheA
MNSALLAQFVAAAPSRLTSVGDDIASLTADAPDSLIRRIGRELHTLKGEARLVGLPVIEQLSHAAEEILFSHHKQSAINVKTQTLLYEALDAIFAVVQAAGGEGQPPSDEAVADIVQRLSVGSEASPAANSPAQSVASHAQAGDHPDVPATPLHGTDTRWQAISVPTALLEKINTLTLSASAAHLRNQTAVIRLLSALSDLKARCVSSNAVDSTNVTAKIASLAAQVQALREAFAQDDTTFGELKTQVQLAMLRPLSEILAGYPTYSRQIAGPLGKQVHVEVHNAGLKLEERVLRQIAEPSLHLLRNAIAHGIETTEERRRCNKDPLGKVIIRAAQEGGTLRLSFEDDGRGLNLDAIGRKAVEMGLVSPEQLAQMEPRERTALIFRSGLSTAGTVSDLAGRGVGLDVVASVLDRIGGAVEVESRPGQGCTFTLRAPMSTSLHRVMVVEACDQVFGIPSDLITDVFLLTMKDIRTRGGFESAPYRGDYLPLTRLRQALGLKGIKDIFTNKVVAVVVRVGDRQLGIVVDRCVTEREIMLRPLGSFMGRPRAVSGLAILEDGAVLVVLSPGELDGRREGSRAGPVASAESMTSTRSGHILYAEDSILTREYTANTLRGRGFEVTEVGDGAEALERLQAASHYDVLLTDLQMPKMDGFKLIAAVRRLDRHRNLPIVIMSTVDTPEIKAMALQTGADAYLVKSQYTVETILSTLEQVRR